MSFHAFDVSLELIRSLRVAVRRILVRDPKLAEQLRAAASSISLNLAERSRRVGKDRTHFYRIAAGSADEVRAALHVAIAWGYLDHNDNVESLALLDRVLAMLWKLAHK